ncbi:MAG: hypothetical protein ACRDP3_27035 [Streptomyces sp.]|uniref:hypothetical protein n=1 Tax=Streptomyces sp. TaxID=1931 RepID=UPI003D6AA42B
MHETQRQQYEQGGEAACWLSQVCDECGRLRADPSREECEHCGLAAAPGNPAGGDRARP